jgi:Ca2+-binding RTX toxin-like protein
MSTIYTLIAGRILAANPVNFLPQFSAANQGGTTYTNPQGTYYSHTNGQVQLDDGSTATVYRQIWASNVGIMLKSVGANQYDWITGGDGNDVIMGDAGEDQIIGGGGDDILFGGGGNTDWLYGQYGNNTIIGGYTFSDSAGSNFLSSWKTMFNNCTTEAQVASKFVDVGTDVKATGANGVDFILTGSGADKVVGLGGDDVLFSGNGDDLVVGDSYNGLQGWEGLPGGDDYIDAGAGDDIVMGNSGNDTIFGGAGDDEIWGDTDPSKVTLVADTGDDYIDAGAGNDTVYGGAGNDTLYGGAGTDSLYGGAGNDYYLFGAESYIDYITENAGQGTDYLGLASNVTSLGLGQSDNGNDLYFFVNGNQAVAVLTDWFVNQAVENLYLEASGVTYNIADLVSQTMGGSGTTQSQSSGASSFSSFSGGSGAGVADGFAALPVELSGIAAIDDFIAAAA